MCVCVCIKTDDHIAVTLPFNTLKDNETHQIAQFNFLKFYLNFLIYRPFRSQRRPGDKPGFRQWHCSFFFLPEGLVITFLLYFMNLMSSPCTCTKYCSNNILRTSESLLGWVAWCSLVVFKKKKKVFLPVFEENHPDTGAASAPLVFCLKCFRTDC